MFLGGTLGLFHPPLFLPGLAEGTDGVLGGTLGLIHPPLFLPGLAEGTDGVLGGTLGRLDDNGAAGAGTEPQVGMAPDTEN